MSLLLFSFVNSRVCLCYPRDNVGWSPACGYRMLKSREVDIETNPFWMNIAKRSFYQAHWRWLMSILEKRVSPIFAGGLPATPMRSVDLELGKEGFLNHGVAPKSSKLRLYVSTCYWNPWFWGSKLTCVRCTNHQSRQRLACLVGIIKKQMKPSLGRGPKKDVASSKLT